MIAEIVYFIDISDGFLSMQAAFAIICVAAIWINIIWSIVEIVSILNKRKDANGIMMAEFQPAPSTPEETFVEVEGNQKSFKAFLLWGLLGLGEVGAHDFYAGYAGRGFMHIALTLISFVVLALPLPDIYICSLLFIHLVWILFEFVNTFKDANGNMMREFKKEHGGVLPNIPQTNKSTVENNEKAHRTNAKAEDCLQKCMKRNHVFKEEDLSSLPEPLTEDIFSKRHWKMPDRSAGRRCNNLYMTSPSIS